ncbi:hypothetical protein RN001_007341 [Aquatica leii]|uniref:Uncharacterized protein n=1 Tax=Aquatica leii TaxID=1421715 RepID=A0AAN7SQW1_9COLE|nr:hypothetical protein RN001_007341 [Aquatica leii]
MIEQIDKLINKDTQLIMQKICRSCMCESTEMRNVFETKEAEEGEIQLAEMLMACTSIQIMSGDGLPVQLCISCETKLDSAFEFKQQCQKTDTALRELTNQRTSKNSIKQEVIQADLCGTYNNQLGDSDGSETQAKVKSIDSNVFTCTYCQKVLRTKKGLKIHERRHTGEKLRSCHLCQAKFTRTNHLRRHIETHNKSNVTSTNYICIECGATFTKACYLINHKKEHNLGNVKKELDAEFEVSHSNEDDYESTSKYGDDAWIEWKEEFAETIIKQKNESDMLKQKENDKPIDKDKKIMECEFCDRKFKYKKSFVHHLQTEHGMSDESDAIIASSISKIKNIKNESTDSHEIEVSDPHDLKDLTNPDNSDDGLDEMDFVLRKLHICHVCDAKFTRANHLTRHMTLHRAVLTEKCDKCDKAFSTTEHLTKHVQEHHIDRPYICTLCDKPFSRGEHLMRHLKVHNHSQGPQETHKCSICEKEFTRPEYLARHTKVHLQQDKRHICAECGKAFNRLDNLKTHQRVHAGLKDNSRLHLCVYCGKEFNNSSNMIVHMRRHTGERPYKCTICSKGFPRSHDLKCHERTHSGEKPYLCTLCGKSFNKSNKLLRHSRVHTGERPYVCNLCGRAFTQSNDLSLHMRRHTGSRPYACGVCPARFIQSGQLKAHRRSTGHWMETQPDLKGGHRVEPVTPVVNPTPIKFKTHGKTKCKEDEDYETKEPPRILSHTVGIMGNVNIQTDNLQQSQPIIIDSTKLIQQFHNGGFVGFTSVINAGAQVVEENDKFKSEIQTYSVTDVAREVHVGVEKMELPEENDVSFSTIATAADTAFSNVERYNYQNYG